jgi:hypothetical protein
MLRIKDYIISLDLLERKFRCDLPHCLGNCCRYGDSGAPLTSEEVIILKEIIGDVRPFLRAEGRSEIETKGTSVIDFEGDSVTPLIGDEECAYAILNNNIYMCGIEKAWTEGKISFRKPLSCHLFPVRIKNYSGFKAVNYEEWSICFSACDKGRSDDIYAYEFLKESLVRALGEEVYKDLCIAATELRKNS